MAIRFPTISPVPKAKIEMAPTMIRLVASWPFTLPGGSPAAAALTATGVLRRRLAIVGVGSGVGGGVGVKEGVMEGMSVDE